MEKERVLSVSIDINQSLDSVWDTWNDEKHMRYWLFISDDYEVKDARNDLRIGGGYSYRMVSRNGGADFDYGGVYTSIELGSYIAFTMKDGRKGEIEFSVIEDVVHLEVKFEAVEEQDANVQLNGWQALLNHFKNHVESLGKI